jgi:hypothetical protein
MRVQIFIDGGNLFHLALKPLNIQAVEFDFDAFANFLAEKKKAMNAARKRWDDR